MKNTTLPHSVTLVILAILTALLLAAHKDRTDIVQALLDKGANVNATDNVKGRRVGMDYFGMDYFGFTALMFAAYNGNSPMFQILLDHGADIKAKDLDGKTAKRIVLGDWYKKGSVLSVDEKGFNLQDF